MKIPNKSRFLILFVIFAFVTALFIYCVKCIYFQPRHLAYRIEQTILIQNTSDHTIVAGKLYIKIPLTDDRQKVDFISLKPENYLVTKKGDLLTVERIEPLLPKSVFKVTYTYKVKVRRNDKWRKKKVVSTDIEPEPDVESDNRLIIQKAKSLSSNEDSVEEKVYKFYKYVSKHIKFDWAMGKEPSSSALESLKSQRGICSHKANLLTALCRADKIPARTISGLTLPKTSKKGGYDVVAAHAWNVVYIEGKGWYFVDPTLGSPALLRKRYWKNYDIYHIHVAEGLRNQEIFKTIKSNLGSDYIPCCEMTGPYYFLLTIKKDSHYPFTGGDIIIRGEKLMTKVTKLKETW